MADDIAARQDRAIADASDDDLDRGPFIRSLVNALVEKTDHSGEKPVRRATGFVVGLTGEWGLGKSSVINMLEEALGSMNQVIVTTFNPWLFKGRDELVQAYFNALRRALGKSKSEQAQEALKALEQYRAAIDKAATKGALIVDAHGGGGLATTGWRTVNFILGLFRPKPPRTPDEERVSLELKLNRTNSGIVVLIDELDRIEDEEVRAVAQLIKAVGDIKGVSYLVAYDPARVAEALGRGTGDERRRSGEAYLEKIVQMPIPLRPLFYEDVAALLPAALRRYGFDLPTPRSEQPYAHEKAIYDQLISSIRTPREVKRLAGSFAVMERMVRGEICVWDVLGYSWIASKTPSLRDRLTERMDRMIDDASEAEHIRRLLLRDGAKSRKETIIDVLGPDAEQHEGMLKALFPRFNERSEHAEGNRLARRRNLIRILYLGNPPGQVPRSEIDEFWKLPEAELRARIEQLKAAGKLGSLLDRLADLLPDLPDSGDAVFWPVFSACLLRSVDWVQTQTGDRALVEDAGAVLWRLGRTGPKGAARVQRAMDALIAAGDLLIAPWLLRKHLFAHGLTRHSQSTDRDAVFDKEQTVDLLQREAPRYRAAIDSGYALRRLPDNEAMYVLGNASLFDEQLRASLTQQLSTMEAIASFAVITVPPGYVSDKNSLNEFVDADAVANKIAELKAVVGLPADDWVNRSVRRLEATLQGRDPHFLSDDEEG